MSEDGSNGYEGIATIYIAGRGTRPLIGDAIGAATVRTWAHAFPPGSTVLDLGSGPGEPSTRILQEAGLATYAVDASSAMVAAFRERFPGVPLEFDHVETSEFFRRAFDRACLLDEPRGTLTGQGPHPSSRLSIPGSGGSPWRLASSVPPPAARSV